MRWRQALMRVQEEERPVVHDLLCGGEERGRGTRDARWRQGVRELESATDTSCGIERTLRLRASVGRGAYPCPRSFLPSTHC